MLGTINTKLRAAGGWCCEHPAAVGIVAFAILGGIFAYLSRQGLLGKIPSTLGPNGVMGISLGAGLLPAVVYAGVRCCPSVIAKLSRPENHTKGGH